MEPSVESATVTEPVKIGDVELTPEQIGKGAFEASELSVDDWNGLTDEERDAKIVAYLDQIRANQEDANSASADGAPTSDADDESVSQADDQRNEAGAFDVAAILSMPANGITNHVKEKNLDAAAIEQLIAGEEAGKNRKTVLDALRRAINTDSDNPAAASRDDKGGKEARGEVVNEKDWQKRDYTGPLSADQALWRGKNIKLK